MNKFKVLLTNDSDDLELIFNLRKTTIADKWYQELSKNYELYETERFSDWGDHHSKIITEINQHIDAINNYDNVIDYNAKENITQHELNYLHKFFEDLRGEVSQMTPWYVNAPTHIQTALTRLNVLIHELESSIRTKNKHPTAVVTFKNSPKLDLAQEDYKYFTHKWKSGTVYINYCQVGKTILDVFKDRDSIAEGVRPQIYYSADFMIKFGPSTNLLAYILRKIWLTVWLKKQNFKFNNLSLGMIPVADLVTDVSKEQLIRFKKVKRVECIR